MTKEKQINLLVFAGLILLATLLVVGCAKKQTTPPAPPPPPAPAPTMPEVAQPDTMGQAAREAAARADAEDRARREAESAAKNSLQVVNFDFDKYNLRPDARETANFDAGVLQKYPNWKVLIEGHCDERGTDEYNLALGERRATTVLDFFSSYGLDKTRFNTISYGETRPADMGHDESAWAKNRRSVLVIQ